MTAADLKNIDNVLNYYKNLLTICNAEDYH